MLKRITKYQNPSNPLPTLQDVLNQQYTEEELQAYKQREEKRKQERTKRFNTSNATRALMRISFGPAVPGDAPVLDESTLDLLAEGKIKEAQKNQTEIDKKRVIATASALSLPLMAGEFATYGALGGAARLLAGTAGSTAGSLGLGAIGNWGDKKLHTNFLGKVGNVVGGFAGFGAGMNATTPILRRLATKGITLHMPQETFMKLRSEGFHNAYNKVKSLPAQVKYYGPTMGKSYAATNNQNLIDLDTWGRVEYDQLAKKHGYRDWREMILSDKGDYNEEYKQLIKDQIKRIQSDPKYNGKTIIVSNASLLKPNSGITFANTPVIPERSVMAARNNARHPWESITHGEEWWDSLQAKGTPLKIDNRFVSEIEGNKVIEFTKELNEQSTALQFNIAQNDAFLRAKINNIVPIEEINSKEGQTIRDLWFKRMVKDTKVSMPQFHSTNNAFWIFDINKPSYYGPPDAYIHVGTENAAKDVGGKRMLKLYINLKNPIKTYDGIQDSPMNIINEIARVKNLPEEEINTLRKEWKDMFSGIHYDDWPIIRNKKVRELLSRYGFDGIEYVNMSEDKGSISRGLIDPKQLKLTAPFTSNENGLIPISHRDNFHNLDIRYKQGGTLKSNNHAKQILI